MKKIVCIYPEDETTAFLQDVYKRQTYNQCLDGVIEAETAKSNIKCVDDLLNSGSTWDIE